MEREHWESLLIDYRDGLLNDAECRKVEQQIESDSEVKKLYEELDEVMGIIDNVKAFEPSQDPLQKKDDWHFPVLMCGHRAEVKSLCPPFLFATRCPQSDSAHLRQFRDTTSRPPD